MKQDPRNNALGFLGRSDVPSLQVTRIAKSILYVSRTEFKKRF